MLGESKPSYSVGRPQKRDRFNLPNDLSEAPSSPVVTTSAIHHLISETLLSSIMADTTTTEKTLFGPGEYGVNISLRLPAPQAPLHSSLVLYVNSWHVPRVAAKLFGKTVETQNNIRFIDGNMVPDNGKTILCTDYKRVCSVFSTELASKMLSLRVDEAVQMHVPRESSRGDHGRLCIKLEACYGKDLQGLLFPKGAGTSQSSFV